MLSINDICIGPMIQYPDGFVIKAVFLSNSLEEDFDDESPVPDWITNEFAVGIPNETISAGPDAIFDKVMETLNTQRFDLSFRSYEMLQDELRAVVYSTDYSSVPPQWTFLPVAGGIH